MYKTMQGGGVFRLADNTSIPPSQGNRDWREYQEWLAEGNTPAPEFTPAELVANTKAEAEAEARDAFEARDKEERWLASPEKAALTK